MQRKAVKSRAIRSVGYQESDQTLEIEFTSGRTYQYAGVPKTLYEWLLRSPSKGGIFNRMIVDKFPELDVTPVAEQDLLEALRRSLQSDND